MLVGLLASSAMAAGFTDAVAWWRMDSLNDSNGANSVLIQNASTTSNNAGTIPGVMSNNKFATLPEGSDSASSLYGFDAG